MSTRDLIDYAAQDDASSFRTAMYAALHDRITAHIEAKKQEIAQGLLNQEEAKPKMSKEEEKHHMKKEEEKPEHGTDEQ